MTSQQIEVLVNLDANKDTTTLLRKLISQTSLSNLHKTKHPGRPTLPAYSWGQHTIDICLGQNYFPTHSLDIGAWYLPFGFPMTLPGDHQTTGVDFNQQILSGHKTQSIVLQTHWGVNSNAYPTIMQYCKLTMMVISSLLLLSTTMPLWWFATAAEHCLVFAVGHFVLDQLHWTKWFIFKIIP